MKKATPTPLFCLRRPEKLFEKSFSGLFKNFYCMGINVIVYLCASSFHSERTDKCFPFFLCPKNSWGCGGFFQEAPTIASFFKRFPTKNAEGKKGRGG
ncbi:MAG: hypothetical protein IKJ35_02390, partial [Clostridia bacterium]|nr:hypothetical protein [Clostridia bacterium]